MLRANHVTVQWFPTGQRYRASADVCPGEAAVGDLMAMRFVDTLRRPVSHILAARYSPVGFLFPVSPVG
jgi:hypothetical protein